MKAVVVRPERLPWPAGSGAETRALVLGAGPVGLLGTMALRLRGFSTIVYSREPASSVQAELRDLGDLAERWPEPLRALITGRHPIEAHRDLLLGAPSGIKNVVSLTGGP